MPMWDRMMEVMLHHESVSWITHFMKLDHPFWETRGSHFMKPYDHCIKMFNTSLYTNLGLGIMVLHENQYDYGMMTLQ